MKNLILLLVFLSSSSFAYAVDKSDAEIKKLIIAESISSYSGNCPCPYNTARNGSLCGKRSAYSRIGGASPICYEQDVSKEMLEQYKKYH